MKVSHWLLGAIMLAVTPMVAAQPAWPERPVKLVVPLGAGAGADILARLYADRFGARWGQPVVVENRPGGDGVVGINAVIGARDDHMFLFGPTSGFVGHPYVLEKLPYDPAELSPVARISSTVVALAVPASAGIGSMKDFVAAARQQRGKFNFATVTTVTDIIVEGYSKSAGLDMTKVSYRDTVSALNDLIESRIQLYSAAYAIVRGQAAGGKVKLLAVMNRSRAPGLDLPTVAEVGVPELQFDGLVGMISARSANLSPVARSRIAADVRAIAAEPAIIERLATTAQLNVPGDAAELAASIQDQADRLAATAKQLGIKKLQ